MRTIHKANFLLYCNWKIDSPRLHNKSDEMVLCVDDGFCYEKQIQFYILEQFITPLPSLEFASVSKWVLYLNLNHDLSSFCFDLQQ